MEAQKVTPLQFGCSEDRGFLPKSDPSPLLQWKAGCEDEHIETIRSWQKLARDLPSYILAKKVCKVVSTLSPFPIEKLEYTEENRERLMQALSYIGHACVFEQTGRMRVVPENLAGPWCAVAKQLQRSPVLSYHSYAACNWQRLDLFRPIALDNLKIIQSFYGGTDEAWFILVHVVIEALAGQCIWTLWRLREAIIKDDLKSVAELFSKAAELLPCLPQTLAHMAEHCDPYIYFHRVRPYLFGWKDNPDIPEGVVYEGQYENAPQFFRGGTGAQSCVLPLLDAFLGIEHKEDTFTQYLLDIRNYMPRNQRLFLEFLEQDDSLMWYCVAADNRNLLKAYKRCVFAVRFFRQEHLRLAEKYISAFKKKLGTGGTPFLPYLKKHLSETKR